MYTIVVFTIVTLSSVSGKSLIEPVFNPGCKTCLLNETFLMYVKAQDDSFNYVIHQLWDFTGHIPTMLYIIGNENSTVNVQWEGDNPTQIQANGSFYSFSIILNNLFEYNDTDGNSMYFDYKYPHREIPLHDVKWRLTESMVTDYETKVRVRGALSWERQRMNGTIDMKLVLVPSLGRSPSLPRLYHSVNTTQIDVSLIGLAVSPQYTAARLALRYVIVSEGSPNDVLQYTVQRSIDDEYTPGVFETIKLMTPAGEGGRGGFVQFRPVAYTQRVRDVEDSITAYVRDFNKTEIPSGCLAARYYGNLDQDKVFVDEVVASFGQTGDDFYNNTKYTVWTYSVGYGTPPPESASAFLILILTFGFVTPVVAICCSFLVSTMMLRRHRAALLEEEEA